MINIKGVKDKDPLYCTISAEHLAHNSDVIMGAMVSQITSLTLVYATVYSGVDPRKHQSSPSLAFVRGIHRWPVYSPHKVSVTRKMFPFNDVIMSAGWAKPVALLYGTWDLLMFMYVCQVRTLYPVTARRHKTTIAAIHGRQLCIWPFTNGHLQCLRIFFQLKYNNSVPHIQ